MEQCILTVGSITHAIRARKLLASFGISARLTKTVRSSASGGCAYSLILSPPDMANACKILSEHGIAYEWSRGER